MISVSRRHDRILHMFWVEGEAKAGEEGVERLRPSLGPEDRHGSGEPEEPGMGSWEKMEKSASFAVSESDEGAWML